MEHSEKKVFRCLNETELCKIHGGKTKRVYYLEYGVCKWKDIVA